MTEESMERTALAERLWPDQVDEQHAKNDFETLVYRLTWEMTDFAHNDRLPWWLCWQAALKAAAKFAAIEAKTMNRPVQKIAPMWLMFVQQETAALEKSFAPKAANDAG